MSVLDQIKGELAEHGDDVALAVLQNLPKIVAWLKSRGLDEEAITRDFEALSREGKAHFDAGRARLVGEAERQRRSDEAAAGMRPDPKRNGAGHE